MHMQVAPRTARASLRALSWVRSWTARWMIVIVAFALYHQWLGSRFSNPYFGGDAIQFLNVGSKVATSARTSLHVAVQSKSPMSALIVGAILRLSHATLQAVSIGIGPTSPIYVQYLAALATLICVTTGLVAWRYTRSARIGCVALVVAGLYAPFVINSERLLTEAPFALFLLLILLCAYEALERHSIGYSILTGGCVFLAIATRVQYLLPLTAFVLAILLGAIAVAAWRIIAHRGARTADELDAPTSWRLPEVRSLVILGTMLLSVLAFLALGDAIVRTVPLNERFGGIGSNLILQQSPYAYVLTDGWSRDSYNLPVALPGASALDKDFIPLTTAGRSLRCDGTGYMTLVCLARKSPGFTIERVALNEFRLWWYPHNDFHVNVPIVTAFMPLYHRCLLLLGIGGLLLLIGQRRRAVLLAAPIVFIAILFSMQHIEVRYAIPSIPFLIVGAAALLVALGDLLTAQWHLVASRQWRYAPSWRVFASLLLVGGAVMLLPGGRFLFMARGATAPAVLLTRVVPLVILVAYGLLFLFRLQRSPRLVQGVSALVAIAILVIAMPPTLNETTDHWSVTLSNAQQQLVQKIIIPTAPSTGEQAAILLDAQALDGDFSDLMVTINERAVPTINLNNGAISLTQAQLPVYYRWQFDESHGARSAATTPQWIAIPIPVLWVRAGENDITLSMRQDRSHPHAIRVFGQFSPAQNDALTMPALFATSLWKTIFDGDPRIQQPVTLRDSTRYSLYRASGESATSDLSPARGIQRGTYHVFLGMFTPAQSADSAQGRTDTSITAVPQHVSTETMLESFWFYGTAPRNTRITLLDDTGPLVTFTSGQAMGEQWHADRADIAYAPSFKISPAAATLNAKADPLLATAPGAVAVQQYLRASNAAAPAPGVPAQEQFTGAYVVHLRQPIRPGTLRFLVAPGNAALGTSWETLMPYHEADISHSQRT